MVEKKTDEMKKVYANRNSAEAGMIISLLKSSGFNPAELNTSSHISIAGADIWYYVRVPESEYEEAKDFLVKNGFKNVL